VIKTCYINVIVVGTGLIILTLTAPMSLLRQEILIPPLPGFA